MILTHLKDQLISSAVLYDEDLTINIGQVTPNVNTGTTDYFVMYRTSSGGTYGWKPSYMPFLINTGTNLMQWDNNGVQTDVTGGNAGAARYYNTYLVLTNLSGSSAVVMMPGRGQYTTAALAQAEDPTTFDWTGLNITESYITYQITWSKAQNTITSAGGVLYNTSKKISSNISSVSSPVFTASLASLTDTVITSPAQFDILSYNGAAWVNSAISYYTQTQSNSNFLSANTSYYTQAQTSQLFVTTGNTQTISGIKSFTGGVSITGLTVNGKGIDAGNFLSANTSSGVFGTGTVGVVPYFSASNTISNSYLNWDPNKYRFSISSSNSIITPLDTFHVQAATSPIKKRLVIGAGSGTGPVNYSDAYIGTNCYYSGNTGGVDYYGFDTDGSGNNGGNFIYFGSSGILSFINVPNGATGAGGNVQMRLNETSLLTYRTMTLGYDQTIRISKDSTYNPAKLSVWNDDTTHRSLVLRNATGQTQNSFEIRQYDDSVLFYIDQNGIPSNQGNFLSANTAILSSNLFVTTGTTQTISAVKTFSGNVNFTSAVTINSSTDLTSLYIIQGAGYGSGAFRVDCTTLAQDPNYGKAFQVGVVGESYARSSFTNDGSFGIGPGNVTRDVYLFRNFAGAMCVGNFPWSGSTTAVTFNVYGNTNIYAGLNVTGNTTIVGNINSNVIKTASVKTQNSFYSGSTMPTNTANTIMYDGYFYSTNTHKEIMVFHPLMAEPPVSNFALLDTLNSIPVLNFNDTTAWSTVFSSLLHSDYNSNNGFTADIYWVSSASTTGNVRWGVSFERDAVGIVPLSADTFATMLYQSGSTNATRTIVNKTSIVFTNSQIDGIVAGDPFRVKVTRDAADGTDTMVGDAKLFKLIVRET